MKKDLTNRESQVLNWIKSYQRDHGGYPTYREIQAAHGLSSINSVSQYIKQLASKGYVEILKNRGYRLASSERDSLVEIPLLGSVQAGNPNSTQEEAEMVTLPAGMVGKVNSTFLLKVRGNSMSEAGIHEGDMVIVDRSRQASLGDVVVARIGEETTVKRLMSKNGKQFLKAESPDHSDIEPHEEWEIQGVVTGLWRQYGV